LAYLWPILFKLGAFRISPSMQTHSYASELGLVKCQAEAAADNRFAAVVILVSPIGSGIDLIRHTCPGTDAMAVDAVAKARAWAETKYPLTVP